METGSPANASRLEALDPFQQGDGDRLPSSMEPRPFKTKLRRATDTPHTHTTTAAAGGSPPPLPRTAGDPAPAARASVRIATQIGVSCIDSLTMCQCSTI